MGSSFGSRGVGLSSEYGKTGGKGAFPPCTRQVGKFDGLLKWANPCNMYIVTYIFYYISQCRLGDSEPQLGEKLDLAIQEEALKHGDLLVGVFVVV